MMSCSHDDNYQCSRCRQCYVHRHESIELDEPVEGSIYWWECRDGFQKPAHIDKGRWASW